MTNTNMADTEVTVTTDDAANVEAAAVAEVTMPVATEASAAVLAADVTARAEAIMFSAAKPVPLPLLGELIDVADEDVETVLQKLQQELEAAHRGLRVYISGAGAELVTAPEVGEYVGRIRKREDKLSAAAMETLAVIAFKQPITKSEMEEVRGVNCEKVIKQLLSRDLIAELGRKETIGRPVLYGTTDTFLHSVGIQSVDALKQEVENAGESGLSLDDVPTALREQAEKLNLDTENLEADEAVVPEDGHGEGVISEDSTDK